MLCQSKYTLFIAWADALGHAAMQRHPVAAAPRAHALSAMGLGGGAGTGTPPAPAHPWAQRQDKAPVSEPSPGPERCWGEGMDLHKEQEEDEDIRSALGEKEGRTKRS